MVMEYLGILGLSGVALLSFDFIGRAALMAGSGLIVVLVGFNFRGAWGAFLALVVGAGLILYFTR
jgi:hypothetical protein